MVTTADVIHSADYGSGVDSLNLQERGNAIDFDGVDTVAQLEGQEVTTTLQMIKDSSDFAKSLNIDGDVSGAYGIFGGSARVDFAKSCQFNEFSVFLVARVTVVNATRRIKNARFKPSAVALLQNGQEQRFRQQFGDLFVESTVTGGEFCAVIQINSSDDTQKQSIQQSIEGHGGFMGFGAKAGEKLSSAISQEVKHSDMSVSIWQAGGIAPTTSVDPDDVIEIAKRFPSQCTGNQAVVYEMNLQDYNVLDLPKMPNWVDLQKVQEVLRQCKQLYTQINLEINQVEYINRNRDQFIDADHYDLEGMAAKLRGALELVYRTASKAVDSPIDAQIPTIELPEFKIPPRKKSPVVKPPVGSIPAAALVGIPGYAAVQFAEQLGLNVSVRGAVNKVPVPLYVLEKNTKTGGLVRQNLVCVQVSVPPATILTKGYSITLTIM